MAGNYPDVPSWRMAYDKDGTQVLRLSGGVITVQPPEVVAKMNNEANDEAVDLGDAGGTFIFMFPEKRDLDAIFVSSVLKGSWPQRPVEVYGSTDSTNGADGTWNQITTFNAPMPTIPAWRDSIKSSSALGIRGVKVILKASSGALSLSTVHLYGEPSPGENMDRLDIWHPTLDELITPAYFDWGNVPRGSSEDRVFRVKNRSSALTAADIRVAMDVLTDASPSVPGQHSISHNGGSFLSQVNIGSLAPGAISLPITLRRVTPTNAQLWLWAFRVFAESDDWQV